MINRLTFCALLILNLIWSVLGAQQESIPGFLVVAPDRGFMGNEEIRDAVEALGPEIKAELVFATRSEMDRFISEGIDRLESRGVTEIVAVPLFVSLHTPSWVRVVRLLESNERKTAGRLKISGELKARYLLAEILGDRLKSLSQDPKREFLILVTSGGGDIETESLIRADLSALTDLLPHPYKFPSLEPVVWGPNGSKELESAIMRAKEQDLVPLILVADFGWKADGMMSLTNGVGRVADQLGAKFDRQDLTPHPDIALWVARQIHAEVPITRKNMGVVIMPHGSDYVWNRTMMDAVESLQSKYMIEFAFSMGDANLMERAVRKLEKRGARAVTVVRVFSLSSSFQAATEYALGMGQGEQHEGHHGMAAHRIRSGSSLYTLGGVEGTPLFAEALLDRALEVSKDAKNETIILVAHGTVEEEQNSHWERNLASIAAHMGAASNLKAKRFRGIQYATWREDWPELRQKAIENVRSMLTEASRDNGVAIVIPARTARGGREEEWLAGLKFLYNGKGFAPHPMFTRWVEEQILLSLAHFNNQPPPPGLLSKTVVQPTRHSGH
jgi:sirohydrochlorin ferrochelatase